jgi:hypothetical protein
VKSSDFKYFYRQTPNYNILKMKFRGLIILIFLIYTTELKSQTDYKPGYIQLVGGDTLYGEIDYRTDIQMGTVCIFLKSLNTKECLR